MRFRDRRHAGRELAKKVRALVPGRTGADPIVLALPRGGVVVAAEVADALGAPLDVLTVRKIGLPGDPEFGIGAIAGEDPAVFDKGTLARFGLSEADLTDDVERERAELRRREHAYRGGRPEPQVSGRTCVLVDDGLATGVTARAAVRWLRRRDPAEVIVALPVCSREGAALLRPDADHVVCVRRPSMLYAVGWWYDDFGQVTDDEVLALLAGTRLGRAR